MIARRPIFGGLRLVSFPLLCLICAGCVSDLVDRSRLPEDAIAVRLWQNEAGRQRRDLIAELEGQPPSAHRQGVLDLGNVGARSAAAGAGAADPSARYPGRLALINPRTLDIVIPEEAPPGARPLSWSPDRTRLIFSSDRATGRFQLYELDLESREVKLVAGGRANFLAGVHTGGHGLAYGAIEQGEDGEIEMVIRKSVPRRPDQVLAEDVAVRHVASSTDGRYIAYAPQDLDALLRGTTRLPRIVVEELEAGARHQLGIGLHPVFTPDGEWIVYSARSGKRELRTARVRVSGSGRTAVGPTVRNEETPAVSPDGKYVVYVSEHNGLDRLFVKRFDGTGDRLLFDGAAVEWPIW